MAPDRAAGARRATTGRRSRRWTRCRYRAAANRSPRAWWCSCRRRWVRAGRGSRQASLRATDRRRRHACRSASRCGKGRAWLLSWYGGQVRSARACQDAWRPVGLCLRHASSCHRVPPRADPGRARGCPIPASRVPRDARRCRRRPQLHGRSGRRTVSSGGTAVDAGIAAIFAAAVVEISHFGLGGEAPMVIYLAKSREVVVINGQGTAPMAATPAAFAGRTSIPPTDRWPRPSPPSSTRRRWRSRSTARSRSATCSLRRSGSPTASRCTSSSAAISPASAKAVSPTPPPCARTTRKAGDEGRRDVPPAEPGSHPAPAGRGRGRLAEGRGAA